MSEYNETLAEIVAVMRRGFDQPWHDINREWAYGLADRIEAAAKRERDILIYSFDPTKAAKSLAPDGSAWAIEGMKSDPAWKDICAKCIDGDIEPEFCAYYGEPNGCNSPIYGEHPTTEKSSAVGNAAAMREAAALALSLLDLKEGVPYKIVSQKDLDFMKAALAKPPRNCDRYTTFNDAIGALADKRGWHDGKWNSERYCILAQWLFAPANEKGATDEKGETDGSK